MMNYCALDNCGNIDQIDRLTRMNAELVEALKNLESFTRHDFAMGRFVERSLHWIAWKEAESALANAKSKEMK